MDKIQRQILKNQSTIMMALASQVENDCLSALNRRLIETKDFFIEDLKEPCCDMEEKKLVKFNQITTEKIPIKIKFKKKKGGFVTLNATKIVKVKKFAKPMSEVKK